MSREWKCLHDEWLEQMDEQLARAVQRVNDEDAGQAKVSVTITVGRDDENMMVGTFAIKAGEDAPKMIWRPETPGQLRIPMPRDAEVEMDFAPAGERVKIATSSPGFELGGKRTGRKIEVPV